MGETKAVLLVVDDAPENLDIAKNLLAPQYVVKAAVNGLSLIHI